MKRIGFAALCGFVLICTLAGCGSTSPRGSPSAGTAGATTTAPPPAAGGSSPTTGTPPSDQATGSTPAPTTTSASSPTSASTTTSTTTTPAINTSVVPRVITVAYVDAVLAKLDAISGNALRNMVSAGHVTSQAVDDLYSIYTQNLAPTAIAALGSLRKSGFHNLRTHPGNQRTTVLSVLNSSPECIFVKVVVNYSSVDITPPKPPYAQYEGLTRRGPLNAREGDPTQCAIFYDNVLLRPGTVSDQCA
jgi:hypothetical protein